MVLSDLSKIPCKLSTQWNLFVDLRNSLNGGRSSMSECAYATRFIRPKHDLMPVISVGTGKFLIASRNFAEGVCFEELFRIP